MRRHDDRSPRAKARQCWRVQSFVVALMAALAMITALSSSSSCSRSDDEGASNSSGTGDGGAMTGARDEPMIDGELSGGAAGDMDQGEILALGRATYDAANCRQCHGASGQGGPLGPDLTDDSWVHFDASPTAAQIRDLLLSGVAKHEMRNTSYPIAMPSVSPTVSDPASIDALATYILSLEK